MKVEGVVSVSRYKPSSTFDHSYRYAGYAIAISRNLKRLERENASLLHIIDRFVSPVSLRSC
jgi:hypothetical protein